MVRFERSSPCHVLAASSQSSDTPTVLSSQFRLSSTPSTSGRPFASISSACSGTEKSSHSLLLLPVGSKRGGKKQQYAWNGKRIIPVNCELLDSGYTPAGRIHDFFAQLRDNISQSFLPRKEDVTSDYWEWLKWRLGQRFFSSTLQNFATQSLLMAVGVGAQRALAASAAINWMLKDGMGRLVRMTVATQFGQSFDSDLKRFRMTTSLLFTACIGCEFLTPFYPSQFLALASVANVGRAVGLTTFVSTQPAFQKALCAGGNMADLAAKTQAQHMVMDTLALVVSASANYLLRHHESLRMMLPLIAFPLCSIGDLYCIYKELKAVELVSLNRERSEMIAERWLASGQVATAADISAAERLLGSPDIGDNFLPMRIVPLEDLVSSPQQLDKLMQRYGHSRYMLSVQPGKAMPWWHPDKLLQRYKAQPHIAVSLEEGARAEDILQAVLEAGCLRTCLRQRLSAAQGSGVQCRLDSESDCSSTDCSQAGSSSCANSQDQLVPVQSARQRRRRMCLPVTELSTKDLDSCLDSSKHTAERSAQHFIEELRDGGWQVKPFLLSTAEKSSFIRG